MSSNEIFLYTPNKNKNSGFNMWMAFPGCEAFSLSSLGYLWMFKSIDEREDINIERICSDTQKTELRADEIELIGFSFSFDMDFLTIFSMLEKYSIPLKSSERTSNHPLIFAGGPVVSANPEPYREFFDFIIIGDGEDVNLSVVDICKSNKNRGKAYILEELSKLDGIYVPSLKQTLVKKLTKRLEECIYTPVLSANAFFPHTFIIEVARGCANRCGFCLASYLNLPLRFMPYQDVIDAIDEGLKHTNKIAIFHYNTLYMLQKPLFIHAFFSL